MKWGLTAIAAASLAVAGCASTTMDERLALGVETAYAAAATSTVLAFRSGVISPSQDADVREPDFCDRVVASTATVTDEGGRIAALDCRAHAALERMRSARTAGNAADYASAFADAQSLLRQINDLINGASQ